MEIGREGAISYTISRDVAGPEVSSAHRRPRWGGSHARSRGSQLHAEQLADRGEVARDALLLPGQLAEFALSCGLKPIDLVVGVDQQLVGLRRGLGDDLVSVLLGVGNELLGALVCL